MSQATFWSHCPLIGRSPGFNSFRTIARRAPQLHPLPLYTCVLTESGVDTATALAPTVGVTEFSRSRLDLGYISVG